MTIQSSLLGILADGSQAKPQPLLVVPKWHYHAHGWSRDSDELLVVAFGETTDVMKLRSGSSGVLDPVVQTAAKEGAEGASLSPDGRWLAYVSDQTGRQIWVQPYGRPGRPVRVSPNGGVEPVWARNNRELFYLEGTRLVGATVSPDATFRFNAPRLLFENPYPKMVQPPSYDVAADGRFLMIKADDGAPDSTTEIVIVQKWHEYVRHLVPSD